MAGNRPYTYRELFYRVAEHKEAVPLPLRPHTVAQYEGDVFDVFFYGSRIASLYFNGSVRIDVMPDKITGATRNRINDVLLPLGWRLSKRNDVWHVRTVTGPYRSMEYVRSMILTSISKED